MHTYTASLFIIAKNVMMGLIAGAVAAWIGTWFLAERTAVIIGGVIALLLVYFALIGDNYRLTLDDKQLRVYRLGKLKHAFPLDAYSFSARVKTTYDSTGSDSDCHLIATHDGTEEVTRLDLSMLGKRRFMLLLDDLGFDSNAPRKLLATKKQARS